VAIFYNTTYPPEEELTNEQLVQISLVRNLAGDTKKLVLDRYGLDGFSDRVVSSGTSLQLENKGWPLRVTSTHGPHTELDNPSVSNYSLLTFEDSDVLSDTTFEVFYETFRFSDSEIKQAWSQSTTLLSQRSLPDSKITDNLIATQAAILLLEAKIGEDMPSYIKVVDGRSEYDAGSQASANLARIESLRKQLDTMMLQVRHHAMLSLDVIRLE
jgi:hypothetical protein